MIKHQQIATTYEVWNAIRRAHVGMILLDSLNAPAGEDAGDITNTMMTEYGFRGCDCPVIRSESHWVTSPLQPGKRTRLEHKYWLCIPIGCDCKEQERLRKKGTQ